MSKKYLITTYFYNSSVIRSYLKPLPHGCDEDGLQSIAGPDP